MSASTSSARLQAAQPSTSPTPDRLSPFEFWPGWLFYAPVVLQWVGLGLRYGDFSLPTAANPGIETGGLCGESKSAILDQLDGPARAWIAPYTKLLTGQQDLPRAEAALHAAAIALPVVVKPDIGCNGAGVRVARTRAALQHVLAQYPRGVTLLLQELIPHPGEAGLFYIRNPDEAQGRITSVTLKSSPTVIGNGRSTLRELIAVHPRAGKVQQLYLARLQDRLEQVPASGEPVPLVFVGNHCRGSVFQDATSQATPALTEAVETIARALPDFHFGRLDVRFESMSALRAGKGFRIIEINGVGSEATHIWDPRTTLLQAWRSELSHFAAAWRIGAAMRARGRPPSGLPAMAKSWLQQRRLMASYPLSD